MDNWLETKNLQVHFVSAAGVVFREGKVLMIRSERRGWEFPGGVVEQGEAILDGLKREILEESGITAEPECVTGIYQIRWRNRNGDGRKPGNRLVYPGGSYGNDQHGLCQKESDRRARAEWTDMLCYI